MPLRSLFAGAALSGLERAFGPISLPATWEGYASSHITPYTAPKLTVHANRRHSALECVVISTSAWGFFGDYRCRDEGRIGSNSLGSILNEQEDEDPRMIFGGGVRTCLVQRGRGQQLPQFCEKCFDADRLFKSSFHRQLLLRVNVGRQDDHFDVLSLRSDRSCELRSIDFSGHTDVGQDQIHVVFCFNNWRRLRRRYRLQLHQIPRCEVDEPGRA